MSPSLRPLRHPLLSHICHNLTAHHNKTSVYPLHHIRRQFNAISSSLLTSHPNLTLRLNVVVTTASARYSSSNTTSDDNKTVSSSDDKPKTDTTEAKDTVQALGKVPINEDIKVVPKLPKERQSSTGMTTGRNFITPIRAMNEYLLKPIDLNDLRKFQRRSPYANEPPITVYLRKDIETKALQIWGSFDALHRALLKRKEEEQKYIDNVFHVKKLLKDFKRQHDPEAKARSRSY
ncbi:unnamed protein product [Medioppia subpectinata]|uniref:Uncharacterized protein n=1 Tax=Medioppia subpectinata TaxID=1979941 RepID=A0A7R9LHU7_9ACAR|nr:unnamed protein product [Medioppia subpectinata]CAG2118861.1 unnamed protein product [Medioppia subpectinata]